MAIVLPLRAQTDARRPKTVRVKDANGMDLGLIHQHNGYWTNYPPDDASLKTRVPIGPFYTMEAAFEAFRRALGDADSAAPDRATQSP
jgi:hypothetical protein